MKYSSKYVQKAWALERMAESLGVPLESVLSDYQNQRPDYQAEPNAINGLLESLGY